MGSKFRESNLVLVKDPSSSGVTEGSREQTAAGDGTFGIRKMKDSNLIVSLSSKK